MANYTILLIDYEPRSIERFRQPLMTAGYAVEVATDGLSGLEAFQRLNPDMVLVEAMIPKKHGFEVCQEIKRSPQGRRTPVLITTGVYKGRKYRTQALHIYGCDEYIEKPIAPEQLLAIVGRFLNGSGGARAAAAPRAAADGDADEPSEPAGPAAAAPASGPSHTPSAAHSASNRAGAGPRAAVKPVAAVRDLTEDEIMARLDAILPTAEALAPAPAAAPSSATGPAREPRAAVAEMADAAEGVPLADLETPDGGLDPFQQMQAELNEELGSLSAALDLEPAPFLSHEAATPPIPSDQTPPPSLLESLPRESPEPETPAPLPSLAVETGPFPARAAGKAVTDPNRIVNFDAKRGRRDKKARRGQDSGVAAAPRTEPERTATPPAEAAFDVSKGDAVAEFSIPSGSLVASTLEGEPAKRGIPAWVWAAAAVAILVGAYAIFFRGGTPKPAQDGAAASAAAANGAVPSDATAGEPSSGGASEANAASPEPGPSASGSAAVPPAATLAAIEPRPHPEPREAAPRTAELPPAEASATPRTRPAEPGVRVEAPPYPAQREPLARPAAAPHRAEAKPAPDVPSAPAAVESAPAAPTTMLGGVATGGVAAVVVPPPAESGPLVPRGALVPLAEADTPPVTLSRKFPAYSLQARQMRIQGTVELSVLVDENGVVEDVKVVKPVPGADVTEAAVKAAKQWTYRPATKNGVAVKVWKPESVAFKL